jgi:hypothetical protein
MLKRCIPMGMPYIPDLRVRAVYPNQLDYSGNPSLAGNKVKRTVCGELELSDPDGDYQQGV